jgi:hypothetical protein
MLKMGSRFPCHPTTTRSPSFSILRKPNSDPSGRTQLLRALLLPLTLWFLPDFKLKSVQRLSVFSEERNEFGFFGICVLCSPDFGIRTRGFLRFFCCQPEPGGGFLEFVFYNWRLELETIETNSAVPFSDETFFPFVEMVKLPFRKLRWWSWNGTSHRPSSLPGNPAFPKTNNQPWTRFLGEEGGNKI